MKMKIKKNITHPYTPPKRGIKIVNSG